MKKILAILLALAMTYTLAACGNKTAPSQDADKIYTVAMVTDYGDIDDGNFNQAAYEGCKKFCNANLIKFDYYRPAEDSTDARAAAIEQAITDGYNVIVTPGSAFAGALAVCVPEHEDIYFIALDVAEYNLASEGLEDVPSNLFSATYKEEICGYMAGYAAVKLGYTHLGYLGGVAVPSVLRYGYGFIQGADAAAIENEITYDVVVEYALCNQFSADPSIVAEMDNWYGEKGAQVVFACGGAISKSVAESASKAGAKIIGVDVNQAPALDENWGEGITLTSAMKGLSATVRTLLTELILNDNWSSYGGRIQSLGLVSAEEVEANYVQLPYEDTQWGDGFTQEDYKALVGKIYSGEIEISDEISENPETTIVVNYLKW